MLGSTDSVDFMPDLSLPEGKIISLPCWEISDICLSDIWIPKHLLTNRKEPSNTRITHGVFHTLVKRGHAQQIESFSVYSDTESEPDIFQSDSDEDTFDLDSLSCEKIQDKENSQVSIEKTENFTKLKSLPSLNNISSIGEEYIELANAFERSSSQVKSNEKRKNKKDKKKNKALKSVTLDQFLEDYTEDDKQEAYANDYLQKILMSQNEDDKIHLKNNTEFPNLTPNELEFIHSDQPETKIPEMSFKTVSEVLSKSDITDKTSGNQTEILTPVPETEHSSGKIILENIPSEVRKDDILDLLYGYGKVKYFSMQQDGNFLKAFIEIDLDSENGLEWITECLNGTDPFGACSKLLKCYSI